MCTRRVVAQRQRRLVLVTVAVRPGVVVGTVQSRLVSEDERAG